MRVYKENKGHSTISKAQSLHVIRCLHTNWNLKATGSNFRLSTKDMNGYRVRNEKRQHSPRWVCVHSSQPAPQCHPWTCSAGQGPGLHWTATLTKLQQRGREREGNRIYLNALRCQTNTSNYKHRRSANYVRRVASCGELWHGRLFDSFVVVVREDFAESSRSILCHEYPFYLINITQPRSCESCIV